MQVNFREKIMKKNFTTIFILILVLLSFGCATTEVAPEKTQLQIREFQTRTYDTNDSKMVMKAMLHVLQDDSYIVKNANAELGFLNATKEIDIENKGEAFFAVFFAGANARWKKNSIWDLTANVQEFGEQCRVRVNFQIKVLDNHGNVLTVTPIQEEGVYQNFFAKVDKGIFIQKENL
jgi:hypothetical protein